MCYFIVLIIYEKFITDNKRNYHVSRFFIMSFTHIFQKRKKKYLNPHVKSVKRLQITPIIYILSKYLHDGFVLNHCCQLVHKKYVKNGRQMASIYPVAPQLRLRSVTFRGANPSPRSAVTNISLSGLWSTRLSHNRDFVWNLFGVNDLVIVDDD